MITRRFFAAVLLAAAAGGCADAAPFRTGPRLWPAPFGARIGPVSRWLSPSWVGSCARCRTTWTWVAGHETFFMWCDGDEAPVSASGKLNAALGMSTLCELCWRDLLPEERLPFYRTLWGTWSALGAAMPWPVVERSVLREPADGFDLFQPRSFTAKDGRTFRTNSPTPTDPDDPGPERWWCR